MSAPAAAPAAAPGGRSSLRWSLPAALLVAEYAFLSTLVDLPTSGPALGVASAARLMVPAGLGAFTAGWLISRRGVRPAVGEGFRSLPPWRPWPLLALQLGAFGATAWFAERALGPGAPPPSVARLLAVLGGVAVCTLLALSTAAPLAWIARLVRVHLGVEIAAAGVGLLAWRAAVLAEGLWGVLRGATVHAVGALLLSVRPDAVFLPEQSIVGLAGFRVAIAPVCSGVDGLGLVLVFQMLWLALARGRLVLGRALLLLPIGAAAALGANVVRIAILVGLGASGHEQLAMGAFHSKLGWLLFLAIALATVLISERVAWFRRPGAVAAAAEEGVPRRAAAYVGPLFAAIAVALLTSLSASDAFDPWYGARALAPAVALIAWRKDLPRCSVSFSWTAVLAGAALGAVWIAWHPSDGAPLAAAVARLSPSARLAWIALHLVASCLVLPLVEELAFRGFLLPWLIAPDFEAVSPRTWTLPAVVLSSLAFGALHDHLALGTLAGAAFAFARQARGRLSDAVLAHVLANTAIAVAVLGLDRWDLWS